MQKVKLPALPLVTAQHLVLSPVLQTKQQCMFRVRLNAFFGIVFFSRNKLLGSILNKWIKVSMQSLMQRVSMLYRDFIIRGVSDNAVYRAPFRVLLACIYVHSSFFK